MPGLPGAARDENLGREDGEAGVGDTKPSTPPNQHGGGREAPIIGLPSSEIHPLCASMLLQGSLYGKAVAGSKAEVRGSAGS